MTAILGISAFYHDSAAALIVDGRIVAAAQEERFTRRKHDERFPQLAIEYCLAEAGLRPGDLDYVGFYDKPLLKFERLLETYLAFAPRGFRSFLHAMPIWLRQKLLLRRELNRGLSGEFRKRFVFAEHHQSHAASAYFPSPFDEAAILTVDGVGEWATAACGYGRGNRIELTQELHFPHSLGLLYSAFTHFCGFKVNSGEYKLMGLAPYGEPRFADLIRERLIDLKPDGSFRLDLSYFDFCHGLTMTSRRFEKLFGGSPRRAEAEMTQRELDLAASIQVVIEEILLCVARHVFEQTKLPRLCLAGGVALNCVANSRILRDGPFAEIWIQPAAGDAGGSLGVALFIWHQLLNRARLAGSNGATDSMRGALLGPRFSDEEIRRVLDQRQAVYRRFESDDDLCGYVAQLIAAGKVVGWFQDRMEFGPRALGARSILGDPRDPTMQSRMNLKIKFRESFRPFAPAVLQSRAAEFFDLPRGAESPYMLLTAPVAAAQRLPIAAAEQARRGLDRRHVPRSTLPAVTHVDLSARVQTVDRERHGRFHLLLEKFAELTGVPAVINTSFNVRGEPIVCTPADALRGFLATGLDALVLERFVLLKSEQPAAILAADADLAAAQHAAQFPLD